VPLSAATVLAAEVFLERLGDEAPEEAFLAQALEPNAAPQMLRDTGVQVHQRLALVPRRAAPGGHRFRV
jgi:hypothetical protein